MIVDEVKKDALLLLIQECQYVPNKDQRTLRMPLRMRKPLLNSRDPSFSPSESLAIQSNIHHGQRPNRRQATSVGLDSGCR